MKGDRCLVSIAKVIQLNGANVEPRDRPFTVELKVRDLRGDLTGRLKAQAVHRIPAKRRCRDGCFLRVFMLFSRRHEDFLEYRSIGCGLTQWRRDHDGHGERGNCASPRHGIIDNRVCQGFSPIGHLLTGVPPRTQSAQAADGHDDMLPYVM